MVYTHKLCYECYYREVLRLKMVGGQRKYPRQAHECRNCVTESVFTTKPFCRKCEQTLAGKQCLECEEEIDTAYMPSHSPHDEVFGTY